MVNKYYETFDPTGMKAKSYQYRYVLWHGQSPKSQVSRTDIVWLRGLSTESMDLAEYFEREAGGTTSNWAIPHGTIAMHATLSNLASLDLPW
jgi:hypothetical protein